MYPFFLINRELIIEIEKPAVHFLNFAWFFSVEHCNFFFRILTVHNIKSSIRNLVYKPNIEGVNNDSAA